MKGVSRGISRLSIGVQVIFFGVPSRPSRILDNKRIIGQKQATQPYVMALQDKTLRLEHMLTERESKIEQLSAQLKAGRATSAQPSMPNQDMAGKDSGPNDDDGRCQSTPAFDGMSDLKLEFQGQIMKLQQYIEANNLRHVDPLGVY